MKVVFLVCFPALSLASTLAPGDLGVVCGSRMSGPWTSVACHTDQQLSCQQWVNSRGLGDHYYCLPDTCLGQGGLTSQGGVRLGLCCQGLKREARLCVLDEGAEVVFPDTSSTSVAPATTAKLGQACGEKMSGAWNSVACDTNQQHSCQQWVNSKGLGGEYYCLPDTCLGQGELAAQGGIRLGLCCQGLKREARICVLDEGTTTSTSITTAAPATTGALCGSRVSGPWATVTCDTDQQLSCQQWVTSRGSGGPYFCLPDTCLGQGEVAAQGGVRLGLCCQGLKREARICVLDEGAEVDFPVV